MVLCLQRNEGCLTLACVCDPTPSKYNCLIRALNVIACCSQGASSAAAEQGGAVRDPVAPVGHIIQCESLSFRQNMSALIVVGCVCSPIQQQVHPCPCVAALTYTHTLLNKHTDAHTLTPTIITHSYSYTHSHRGQQRQSHQAWSVP